MPEEPWDGASETAAEIVAQVARIWAKELDSITKQLGSFVAIRNTAAQQVIDSVRPFQSAIQSLTESIKPFHDAIARIDFSWVRDAWLVAMPPNWRDLQPSDIDHVLSVMEETGWCLVWCPRVEIVRALIDAADVDARTQLLLNSKDTVVKDMEGCLAGLSHPESSAYRRAAELAIRAFKDGHVEAAQALAGADISAIINGGFHQPSFAKARARFEGDPKEASINAFREQAVYNMVARSLQEQYYAHRNDPVPRTFSRNATAHSVSDEQYTEVNSLASLLLVVAFTTEADLLMEMSDQQEADVGSGGR